MSAGAPSWQRLAALAGIEIGCSALRDLLCMLDRVLVRGEGWGLRDAYRGRRSYLPALPSRLAARARRRSSSRGLSARSYRRAIAAGIELGLLDPGPAIGPRGARLLSPGWVDLETGELRSGVWETARERLSDGRVMAGSWPGHGRVMAGCPVRSQTDPNALSPIEIPDISPGQTRVTANGGQRTITRHLVSTGPDVGSGDPESREPRSRYRDSLGPLPIRDDRIRDRLSEILEETHSEPVWEGLRGIIIGELRDGTPEQILADALTLAYGLWERGEIEYPKAYARRILRAKRSERHRQTIERPDREQRAASAVPAPEIPREDHHGPQRVEMSDVAGTLYALSRPKPWERMPDRPTDPDDLRDLIARAVRLTDGDPAAYQSMRAVHKACTRSGDWDRLRDWVRERERESSIRSPGELALCVA